jgi:hypothetical protein
MSIDIINYIFMLVMGFVSLKQIIERVETCPEY